MLKVLGKGTFGKVSGVCKFVCIVMCVIINLRHMSEDYGNHSCLSVTTITACACVCVSVCVRVCVRVRVC